MAEFSSYTFACSHIIIATILPIHVKVTHDMRDLISKIRNNSNNNTFHTSESHSCKIAFPKEKGCPLLTGRVQVIPVPVLPKSGMEETRPTPYPNGWIKPVPFR